MQDGRKGGEMRKVKKSDSMDPLRKMANLYPAIGYMAGLSIILNGVRDIFDVNIIKRFKLWSGYQIWIVRNKK